MIIYQLLILILILGLVGLCYVTWRLRLQATNLTREKNDLIIEKTILQQQIIFHEKALSDHQQTIQSLYEIMKESFQTISQETLLKNHASIMEMAKQSFEKVQESARTDLNQRQEAIKNLVEPMKVALSQVDEKLQTLEKERTVAYVDLKAQVKNLIDTQKDLKDETANLVKALRNPTARGQWGEFQLKRVVELAGMVEHCDFVQQETSQNLRPDMIVRLPGGKQIVVDAKTPLFAYLNAIDAKTDQDRKAFLADHANHVRTHIKQLSQKSYWEQFKNTPEFVVMFIPSESLFSAALESDPSLIEFGANERVILATPTTLIALLRAVAYGWRQESIHESIQEIATLGQELYKRFYTVSQYFGKLGAKLNQSVDSYNQTLASIENRLLPVMRKFDDMKSIQTDGKHQPLTPIDAQIKSPQAMEFHHHEQ
ncbi:MAG: DNA recombination protein RmuC [Alphaproteobacteria bacterium]|nr:DNA recombination protein RmuC [Alphaproteobacteria bacterium]